MKRQRRESREPVPSFPARSGGAGGSPSRTPAMRLAVRFSVLYFTFFVLATQVGGSLVLVPGISFRGLGPIWPMREVTLWVARHVFGITRVLDTSVAGGETAFFWVQSFWLSAVALLGALVWSFLDRERGSAARVQGWFLLLVRFGLAAQMFEYGMTKIIRTQFREPSLTALVTPAGDLTLSAHLWTSIGAAPIYQSLTGWAELLGGVLLLVPGMTLLGALITLADMIQVFFLNMGFDIGLKLTSFHLILLALVLLAPDARRLTRLFLGRSTEAPAPPMPGATRKRRMMALSVQLAFGAWLLTMQAWANLGYWYSQGGGAPRSPLYGIWNVVELSVDGEVRPVSLNDYDRRWRRVIFETPEEMTVQRTDDSFARYGAAFDIGSQSIVLQKGDSRSWQAVLAYRQLDSARLVLDGEIDGHSIRAELRRLELDTFRLLNSDFRWVYPGDP